MGANPAPTEDFSSRAEIVPTLAGTTDVDVLIRDVPFQVHSVSAFLFDEQRFVTYIPGAPSHVNAPMSGALTSGSVVWLRVPPGTATQAADWESATRGHTEQTVSGTTAHALRTPAPGGLTVGIAGTTSLDQLIAAQPFRVASVMVFDLSTQRFMAFVSGAPSYVNSLATSGALRPNSIVWMRRSFSDAPPAPAPAATPAAAPASAPASTPSATPAASPTASATASPTASAAASPTASATASPTASATASPTASATAIPTATPAPASTPAPVRSSGGLLRHTTYEPGSATREESHTTASHSLGTTSTARTGSRAGTALLKPGDPSWHGGGYRAEWHAMDHTSGPGAERWQGISFYFPEDYNQGHNSSTWNDRIIFQYTDEGSPMFSLHLDAERQELWLRRKTSTGGTQTFQELGRWSFQTGRWYDLAFHAKWTKDSSGVFEVYVDGKREVSYSGRTLAIRDVTYSKWGIYGQPTHLFFDEIRIAEGSNRLADVTP